MSRDSKHRCAGVDIGFTMFILLRQLVDAGAVQESLVRPSKLTLLTNTNPKALKLADDTAPLGLRNTATATYDDAYSFFEMHTGRVEIAREGEVRLRPEHAPPA